MKKIILLLILPFVTLMAIDFTMTRDGLIAPSSIDNSSTATSSDSTTSSDTSTATSSDSTTSSDTSTATSSDSTTSSDTSTATSSDSTTSSDTSTATSSDSTTSSDTSNASIYLEPVNLPKCDAGNTEVQFIRSKADWSKINSSSKRIFCVSPGDYTSLGNIKLTASGTVKKRRYIILNNGNDTHPGKLDKSQLANFALEFQAASYWVVDRASSFDVGFTHSFLVGKNSTYNIFNRMFTQNVFHTMWIRNKAHYNTIQNGRFDSITKLGAGADLSTINIMEWGDSVKDFYVYGTKAINNEFVNVTGIRFNRFPAEHLPSKVSQLAHFDGSIFDSNTIEFNDAVRSDCNGHLTPNGNCMFGEGGIIGIKGGSDDSNKPMIISNNIGWGYRPADPTFENLSNKGGLVTVYMGSRNVHVLNNIAFDGTGGIMIADAYEMKRGTWDAVIKYNIIVDCGKSGVFPFSLSQAEGMDIQNNLVKDSIGSYAFRVSWNMYNNYVGNNDFVGSVTATSYEGNWEPVEGITTNKTYATAEAAGYTEDFTFTADKFTNNPRTITLDKILKHKQTGSQVN